MCKNNHQTILLCNSYKNSLEFIVGKKEEEGGGGGVVEPEGESGGRKENKVWDSECMEEEGGI